MKKERGFSLVELLIVIAIIGIVSAIAVPSLLKARMAAYETRAVSYLRTWVSAQELYRKRHQHYATADDDLVAEGYIGKGQGDSGTPDDAAYIYSIGSEESDDPNWWGTARRRSHYVVRRSFFINQSGVIRNCECDAPSETDNPIGQ